MNIPFLGQIPIVLSIREGGDQGIPVAWQDTTATGMAFKDLAINVVEQLNIRNANLRPTERVRIKKS